METRATKRDIAIILFRLLSIYSFIVAADMLADNVTKLFNENYSSVQLLLRTTMPSALMMISGLMIWYISPALAARLSRDLTQDKNHVFSIHEMQEVAFSTIGLFILVNALPDLIYQLAVYYRVVLHLSDVKSSSLSLAGNLYLISLAIKLLLGIWLLIGSRRIVKIVSAMRRD